MSETFDRDEWLRDLESERQRILTENGGEEVTVTPQEFRAYYNKWRAENQHRTQLRLVSESKATPPNAESK